MTNHAALRYKRSPIIVLSFDHRGCFLMNILGSRKPSAIFTQDRSQEGEKAWFRLRIRRILFAARHLFAATTLRISRPLLDQLLA